MPTLKGKWYFKEHLNLINTNYSFHLFNTNYDGRNIIKVGDNIETYELHVAGSNANLGYGIVYGAGDIFAYADSWQNDAWKDESYRLIEFLEPITVEKDFYMWFTSNATKITNTKKIQGKWYFNAIISEIPDYEAVTFQFTYLDETYEGLGMDWRGGDGLMFYVEYSQYDGPDVGTTTWMGGISGGPPLYYAGEHRWIYPECRTIDFGETPQPVSEAFYNWLRKNAIPLTIEGTWRFNKNIQFPTQYISLNSDKLFFKSNDFEGNYLDASDSGFIWYVSTANGGVAENIVYEQNTWTNEAWREIEFLATTEISPEFAIWFYENAHPTEVVICSEAYVAEIAHNIRQIKRTTQRYAVKNLANEIRNLYINANEEVY